jgi:hypothetical protein
MSPERFGLGHTILHYRVVEKIGLGEVYRAKDINLGRDAVVKVLPAGFANDAERMQWRIRLTLFKSS